MMRERVAWYDILKGEAGLPAAVFLHGFMGAGTDWDCITDSLSRDFRCYCPDLPGHGGTVCAGPLRMEAAAEALVGRLDALHIERCTLIGYSMGGRLALYLALTFPERFARVVLESTSPGLKTEEERRPRREHDERLAQRLESLSGDAAAFAAFLEEWYQQPLFAGLRQHSAAYQEMLERRARNNPRALAAALRGMGVGAQPSLWERLPGYRTPTLLIVGEADRKFRIAAEEMCEVSPAIAVEVLTGCGHNVHLENPSGYTTVLKRFLESAR